MNKKKSTGLLLSILGVLSLVLITAGVTYAFFSYAKEGLTENTISTGTITFVYDELADQEGNQIKIENALPMSDSEGMALEGEKNVFNFKVTSTVSGDASIPYEVTARKKSGTLSEDQIKLYLESTGSETNGENFTVANGEVKTYKDLTQTATEVPAGTVEKTIYKGTVPGGSNYTQNFELRMWIAGDKDENGAYTGTDYSAYEFVKKSAFTTTGDDGGTTVSTTALSFDTLLEGNNIITSTAYYALDDTARAEYERIAYVNTTSKTLYTVTQAAQTGFDAGDHTASEQYYPLNGQNFTVTVNVYANATVVTGTSN